MMLSKIRAFAGGSLDFIEIEVNLMLAAVAGWWGWHFLDVARAKLTGFSSLPRSLDQVVPFVTHPSMPELVGGWVMGFGALGLGGVLLLGCGEGLWTVLRRLAPRRV